MKKIVLTVAVFTFLSVFSLTAFARPKPPVFSSLSSVTLNGIMKSANVIAWDNSKMTFHRVARFGPKSGQNMSVTFTNSSSVKSLSGYVKFNTDGVWFNFDGPFLLTQAEHVLRARVLGTIIVRLDNKNQTVSFDPVTGLFSGSGEILKITGAVDMAGVIKSGGGRAMLKAKITPISVQKMSAFWNGTTVTFGNGTTLNYARVIAPAVQLIKAP